MREKSKHCGLEPRVFGIVCEAFQYLTVSKVHTIKSADGHHCMVRNMLKIRNVMDCFQRNIEIKKGLHLKLYYALTVYES